MLQNLSYIAVIAAAITSLIALILNIVKAFTSAKTILVRHRLEYLDKFGDYLANYGLGPMKIIELRFYFDGALVEAGALVKIYQSKLSNNHVDIIWSTYLYNTEIKSRWISPGQEVKLIEINPMEQNVSLGELKNIQDRISIVVKYKNTFSLFVKKIKLD